jgi:hypothetical protein
MSPVAGFWQECLVVHFEWLTGPPENRAEADLAQEQPPGAAFHGRLVTSSVQIGLH